MTNFDDGIQADSPAPGVPQPRNPDRAAAIPSRKPPKDGFYWQDNELIDLYAAIFGPYPLAIYGALCRNAYGKATVEYSVRGLAHTTGMSATVAARSIEILEDFGVIGPLPTTGNRKSVCQLFDLKALAEDQGAMRERKSARLAFPPLTVERLNAQIQAVRRRQQGKGRARATLTGKGNVESAERSGFHALLSVSQRDATVSHLIHQRSTRETQPGTHLLRKERRSEEIPAPTPPPAHHGETQTDKDFPDEYEPEELIRWARVKFTGVMKDMESHLLDTSRPPVPHLANGGADWSAFGFNSFAVERVRVCREGAVELVLSVKDLDGARRGLEKYRRKWDECLRKWYQCELTIVLERVRR